MAGVYPLLLILLLLVAAAQLGLIAFLISCLDANGWPGQRESGPLIVKALYVSLSPQILSDLTYGLPSLFMLLIDSGWTMLGSILFVAFGDETNRIFTGVTCLGWLFVTILLWVRVNINTNIPADQLSP